MEFEEKLTAALEFLESTGIRRSNYAPPLIQLLWKAGLKIPPPHFVGFVANSVVMGTLFGTGWGLIMWFVFWSGKNMPPVIALGAAIAAGLLFGLCMSGYYRYGAQKHGIPLWKDFRPGGSPDSRR